MKNLYVRPEIIKILEENTGSTFNINCNNFLLDMSPEARETKARVTY